MEEERLRVQKLLDSLRIQAETTVTYLSNGNLKSYETIVNGSPQENPVVEHVLGKEEWWKELQRRRKRGTVPRNVTDISTLFGSTDNLSGSFQQGSRQRWEARLSRFVSKKKKHTMSGLSKLGVTLAMTMRANRLSTEVLISDSDPSDLEEENGDSSSDESSESVVSEGDLSDYQHMEEEPAAAKRRRRASTGDALVQASKNYGTLRHHTHVPQLVLPQTYGLGSQKPFNATVKDQLDKIPHGLDSQTVQNKDHNKLKRPEIVHRVSSPSFTSRPVPDTQISLGGDDTECIGFYASTNSPTAKPTATSKSTVAGMSQSQPKPEAGSSAAGGSYLKEPPLTADTSSPHKSIPSNVTISFNDLPSKAQHLILNELMRQYSGEDERGETVVLFTTLPAPAEGTYKSESDSVEYLSGLELLTGGLPPTLLVHSNSLTVTTAL